MLEVPVIEAISLIWKLLPKIDTLTGAKRREFFNEVVEPVFKSLDAINDFYNKINVELWHGVMGVCNKSLTLDQVEDENKLRELKENYLEQRKKDEYLRDALRRDATDYLSKIKWPEESDPASRCWWHALHSYRRRIRFCDNLRIMSNRSKNVFECASEI